MTAQVGFVGRQSELTVLDERLAAAQTGRPQVVCVEGEAGAGKSTLLSRFAASLTGAVVLEVGGDEAETLLSYGVIDQLQPGTSTEPGADPMAVGATLLDLFDHFQSDDKVVVIAIDDLQWADRPSSRAVLFALRRLRADKVLVVLATAEGLADPGWARLLSAVIRVSLVSAWAALAPATSPSWRAALGLGALSARGASRLAEHTHGNALYCRALLDEIGVVGLSGGDGGLPAPRDSSGVILAPRGGAPAHHPGIFGGRLGAGAALGGGDDRVGRRVGLPPGRRGHGRRGGAVD